MRNMSFAETTRQMLESYELVRQGKKPPKTVTRRVGWRFLKPGERVQPVEKAQGLKKGERVKKLGPPIRIVSVSRGRLCDITAHECCHEGFPGWSPMQFIDHFRWMNRGNAAVKQYGADVEVTRIEFEYPFAAPSDERNGEEEK